MHLPPLLPSPKRATVRKEMAPGRARRTNHSLLPRNGSDLFQNGLKRKKKKKKKAFITPNYFQKS